MASNILSLPFRRTHPISLSAAIKSYISSKYDQHPDMFTHDLDIIEMLRSDAIHVREPHASGIRKLAAYAAQLVWIGGKFPIDIGVDFTWYPALGYNTQRPSSQNNIRFELANVLYNLAALYSQLAISQNRSTTEGLKSACNYFCLSAGVVAHIQSEVIPDMRSTPPEDMDSMTLECLKQLSLAQAQECFWQKAVMDGFKDASIAKLAAKVSDYYSAAGDWGIQSDSISSEWIHHMTAKHYHFAAAAQYRAACDCLEKRKFGEEVARLRDSVGCVNEALDERRWINSIVLGDLQGLKNRVQEDLKRAEKDNDMIYLLPVPPKPELKTLDRANMASVKIPKEISESSSMIGENREFGAPLFAKLVPYAVHVSASIYVERRDRLVNDSIIHELQNLTTQMHDFLQSLNLPGALQALEKPLGLPPSLISHAEEIRQGDGLNRLRRSMDDVAKLKASDRATYNEGADLLKSESYEDDQARKRYGTNTWTRPSSQETATKLYGQLTEIDGYLQSAENSDGLVKGKLAECENLITLLAGPDRDIEDFVPSTRRATMTVKVEREVATLRGALNEVTRLESRRRKKIGALKEKAKSDDISSELLAEAARLEREWPAQKIEPAQFEYLFEQRLQRYDVDRRIVPEEEEEQAQFSARVKEANSAFLRARKGDSSTKDREQALQKLENAYFKYKEIVSNLDVGRKFYNDLAKIVGRFRDDCKTFVYQRRVEAGQIESDITNAMSSLSLSHTNSLQQQKAREDRSMSSQEHPRRNEPLVAPVPTRVAGISPSSASAGTWTPDIGIKFAGLPNNNGGTHKGQPHPQANQNGTKPRGGTWDPNGELKFM
ncbi:MAG: pH-response regulator protein palA/rim20 [Sclerophora amabilis]|nr:MAG: pH-response regulator protein palA/rim20 [Sclerophora amabilis]